MLSIIGESDIVALLFGKTLRKKKKEIHLAVFCDPWFIASSGLCREVALDMIPQSSSLLTAHNVTIVGDGDQYVVLSHGFGSDQTVWKYLLPYLVSDYRVLLYDLMGAGSTNPKDFSFSRYSSLHAYADDLLAILDELEIESCTFVGASVSGMIGCLASIERPEVFTKLILLASSPRYLICHLHRLLVFCVNSLNSLTASNVASLIHSYKNIP